MNRIRIVFAAVLFLLFGTFAYAQATEEVKPPPQEDPKPENKRDEAKPAKEENAKPPKQENGKPETREAKLAHEDHGQKTEPASHGRPAGKSVRIPDEKFRASFGRQHTFVVNRPVIVEGRPRFQYTGYWFEIIDPWPVYWAYTDECYVDYTDGEYFLFDVLHPGVRVAVFIVG
jgi:hypothetical protein